jgi:hypothetical protein
MTSTREEVVEICSVRWALANPPEALVDIGGKLVIGYM